MKSSTSTLNPFAVSYVPLAKREVDTESKTLVGGTAVPDTNFAVDNLKLKGQHTDVAQGPPSGHLLDLDSKFIEEESEMDLAYLQMMFPGVSDQSLTDVYNVNMGDLDAAIDMLTHLEAVDEHSGALAAQGTQEPVTSGDCSSVKAMNVPGESSSSPAPSSVTVATS